jgi:hypothetical protein
MTRTALIAGGAAVTAPPELDIDPFDEEFLRAPEPFHQKLRDAGPVVRLERYGIWSMARFAEVQAALRDHQTFCSKAGVGLSDLARRTAIRGPGRSRTGSTSGGARPGTSASAREFTLASARRSPGWRANCCSPPWPGRCAAWSLPGRSSRISTTRSRAWPGCRSGLAPPDRADQHARPARAAERQQELRPALRHRGRVSRNSGQPCGTAAGSAGTPASLAAPRQPSCGTTSAAIRSR